MRGTKNTFGSAWGTCWIIIPYASVSGKTLLKFGINIFLVGLQNLNIMSGSKVLTWGETLNLVFPGHQMHILTHLDERNTVVAKTLYTHIN